MDSTVKNNKPRIFYGWYIVIAVFFANWMGAGIGVPVFGLFFKPMSSDLGWNRAITTVPLVMRNALAQFTGPIIGPMVDKYGPRYLMTIGAIIAGVGTMLMSQTNSVWQFFLFFSIIGAIGNAGLSHIVTNTAIAKWFIEHRGRATGLAATGINVGEAVMTPLIHVLITTIGWRGTWVIMGLVPWLIIAPSSYLLMRRSPEDMGLKPDGDIKPAQDSASATKPTPRLEEPIWTPSEAFRTPTLWLLLGAISLGNLSVSGVLTHQIPYLTDNGLSPGMAALTLTTYAIFAIPSKILWGFLSEKIHIRYLGSICLIGSSIGLIILINADTNTKALSFGVVYGLTRGSWAVVQSLLWADYFGRHFLGSIRGYTAPFQLISWLGGPIFAALVFDTTGSYAYAFMLFIASYILGAVMVLIASPPRTMLAHN